jgi:hypothetical protein
MKQLQDEINFFLEEKNPEKEKKTQMDKNNVNPFFALFGMYDRGEKKEAPKKEEKKEDNKPIRPDNWIEKTHLRALAEQNAKTTAMSIFDIYKKSHGMASYT